MSSTPASIASLLREAEAARVASRFQWARCELCRGDGQITCEDGLAAACHGCDGTGIVFYTLDRRLELAPHVIPAVLTPSEMIALAPLLGCPVP